MSSHVLRTSKTKKQAYFEATNSNACRMTPAEGHWGTLRAKQPTPRLPWQKLPVTIGGWLGLLLAKPNWGKIPTCLVLIACTGGLNQFYMPII